MSIDRIGMYGGFYNQYRVNQIPSVSVEEVKKQDQEASAQEQVAAAGTSASQEYTSAPQNQASRIADLEDISLTFNKNETYDYIGKDAGLENLDMMSAISDMQKDKVLEQYQYFVGPKAFENPVVTTTPDGMVVQK
nr:hypothetical protein [Lachnospiraceae bacterium]